MYLKHNSFAEDIPVVVVMKAMGVVSDKEIATLIGHESLYLTTLGPSLEACAHLQIFTQHQALDYIAPLQLKTSLTVFNKILKSSNSDHS